MINNQSGAKGHRTVKSRDININTGSINHSVILQVIKSLAQKYESKVIEQCLSNGDPLVHEAQVTAGIRFSALSSRRLCPTTGENNTVAHVDMILDVMDTFEKIATENCIYMVLLLDVFSQYLRTI